MKLRIWKNNQVSMWQPNAWDFVAMLIIFALFAALAYSARQMASPYHLGETLSISLQPSHLPNYALRTVFRMFIALLASLVFTFAIGSLAAKNKHAERVIIPLIDILQSVPVLGFLSITVVGFIALFPHSLFGPELAAIFAIFVNQAWNMFLGFYQSLKTLPHDLREASDMFQLSAWQRFWRVEVPFATPSLIWNMMMSMSGSWFFITVSEAITVNNQHILLPGVGSYIAMAIIHTDKTALLYAILTMLVVILLYDQLLFRPLISWSERFKSQAIDEEARPKSLLIDLMQRTRLLFYFGQFFSMLINEFINLRIFRKTIRIEPKVRQIDGKNKSLVFAWYGFVILACACIAFYLSIFIYRTISLHEILHVFLLGSYTSIRVVFLIILCSIIWVPLGVWIGMNAKVAKIAQPIAQFLAAFPANLFFPVVGILILKYSLNINIWTSPLMILGAQWYILFNVIAGTTALPKDLIQVAKNLGLKKWLWWKRFILPGIFPYFITGAITAAGGAWNASIVAEFINWGDNSLHAAGLGAYITEVTTTGDFPRVALGIGVMCLYVLVFNKLIWQPLYNMAEKKFQIN
jgi:NitT/TauT family transport system permease protein